MLEYLIIILIGIAVGTATSLIPGIGTTTALILSLPFVLSLSVDQIIVYYISLYSIGQFVGSIPAIMIGVPGEYNSMPCVVESKRLITKEQKAKAIVQTAIASTWGGFLVLASLFVILPNMNLISQFYRTEVQLIIFSIASLLICYAANKFWASFLLFLFGALISKIGYHHVYGTEILTFGNIDLFNGIPLIVVVTILFALPQIYQSIPNISKIKSDSFNIKLSASFPNLIYCSFFSVTGFFAGLMPGLTTILSSQSAYAISKKFTSDPIKRIVASEAANNAGGFSVLLPLFILAIPIVPSEALLLNMVQSKGFIFSPSFFEEYVYFFVSTLIFVNLIGLVLAWPLSMQLMKIYQLNFYVVIFMILMLLFIGIAIQAYVNHQLIFYLLCVCFLMPIAILIRNLNTMPLVFGFLIESKLMDHGYRFLVLYDFVTI